MIGVIADGGVGGGGSGGVTGIDFNNITLSSTQVNFKFKIYGSATTYTVTLTPGTYTPTVLFNTLTAACTAASGRVFTSQISYDNLTMWMLCTHSWYVESVSNCIFSIFDEIATADVSSYTNLLIIGAYHDIGLWDYPFSYTQIIYGTETMFGPQEISFRLLSDALNSHSGDGGIGGTGSNGGAGHHGGDGGNGGEGGNAGESKFFADAGNGTDESLGGKGGFGKVLDDGTNGDDGIDGAGGDVGTILRTATLWPTAAGVRGYNYSVGGHIYGGAPGAGGEGGTNTIVFPKNDLVLKTYGNGGNGGSGGRGAAGATGISADALWDVETKAAPDYTPADSITTTPDAGSTGVSGTDGCVVIEWDASLREVAVDAAAPSAPSAARRRRMRF
jgi:hypothetical protein